MTQLLVYREKIQKFYQKYSFLLYPVFRFVIGYVVFSSINRVVGYHPSLNNLYIELLMGGLCILLPGNVMLFFTVIFVIVHIYYASVMLAWIIGIIFSILYFAYVKFVPEQAYVILAFPVLFSFNMVYALPLYLGLSMSPLSLIPILCGTGTYYLLSTVTSVISTTSDMNTNLYHVVVEQFFENEEMYAVIFVFYVAALVVYLIRNRNLSYAHEKAVVIGGITSLVLLFAVNFIYDLHMDAIPILFGTFASILCVLVIQFMRLVLNYASVEHLQFEDEEYVYYVRAVPKANVAAPSKRIKHFSVRRNPKDSEAD